ncbi:MAG TPA: polyketide synthase, partial [Thermoanaerobaculia bacterium]|nr:polyketide synthase [Thermoanaerobaculia bacterium]
CDRRGNVAAQLQGLEATRKEVAAPRPVVAAAPLPAPAPAERKKPAISLAAPGAAVGTAAARPRPSITLAAPAAPAVSSVQLHDEGNGVFAVDLAHAGDVRQALERARQESSLKVLLLHGLERGCDPALYQPLVSFPYPTVAVLERDAAGTGFLAAALCDFMVCSEEASYAFAHPTPAVARLFTERFGAALAQRFLAGGAAMTGRELREQGCACPCAPRHEVRAQARAIASTLATKSRDAIRILKGHLARHIAALAGELAVPEAAAQAAGPVEVIRFRDAAELIARLQQPADAGALVLAGDDWTFADDAVAELQRLLLDSEVPVVAALAGDVKGNGWLAAQLCDAAVYDRNGVYSAAGIGPLQTAAAAFLHRFGSAAAGELLLTGAESSGAALLRRLGTLTVADCDDVVAAATRAAESWARLPRATVAAWKQQLRDAIRNMPAPLHDGELPELPPDVPTKIALRSTAVTATAHPEGILVVAMEDREAKNMFSDAFVEGVAEAFAHAARTPAYKVVVLTGFDSYFASGGTKEGLVAIQQGKVKFTDVDVHQMALDCRLPVVAAMQGHGIGAGWCLGLFADVVLLSEESRYVSPYMEYGFTPGAGATFILADRIGQDLARESLLTARQLAGSELKARGLRLPILPRAEVVEAAMEIARQIARGPRGRLLALKQLLAAHVRRELPETYRRELAMHEQTFVGQSDTLAQIQSKFAPELEKPQVAAPVAEAAGHGDVLRAVTVSLRALLARELHLRESDVEDDAEFVSLGLDSISAVTFVRAINERYKTSIEATKIYRFPTLAQLAAFVKEEAERHGTLPAVAVAAPPPVVADVPAQPKIAIKPGASRLTSGRRVRRTEKPAAAPAPEPAQAREAIAVVGMSGRFPQARNLDEYWRNLEAGRNSITEVPPDRWDVRQYDRARWLGVLDDVDRFDPLFFRIAPQEAEYMDPQHRLFLQESYRAFEDAGYAGRDLSDKKCGVYLGMSINDYAMLLLKRGIRTTPVTANSFAVAAARIAYYLNLKGPAITVDTACSSSLVAIHLACQSLLSGETDMALAGGVTLWLTPESHLSMSEAGMLSADGQCKAFDDSADGIVVSEGVGALVLKRLKDAEADGDVIHGVILGSGINQDGRTNGITAPSVNSQIELERSIYAKFGIDPATISYVEAHGTGTKLGDPIELEALAAAFREKTDRKNYCAIGSVKSNIGHTASAAGVASVLKVLLSLRHRTLVPTLHVTKENSHFDFASSPFYVCREKQAWEPVGGARRRAAVSSFGYSGTNSHLVLEEYVPSADGQTAANGPVIVPLSARTAEQLQQKARELAERLRGTPDLDLQSVAYTLQVGRDAMDERAAFLAGSVEELAGKLTAFAEGGKGIEHAWQGRVEAAGDSMALIGRDDDIQEAVDKWIARGKLAKLAELWSRGLNFDWQKLWGAARPRRASLPTYPFARDRYWIDKVTASAPPAENPFANIVGMDSLSSDSIEEILGRIDGGALETERAVRLLRMLV